MTEERDRRNGARGAIAAGRSTVGPDDSGVLTFGDGGALPFVSGVPGCDFGCGARATHFDPEWDAFLCDACCDLENAGLLPDCPRFADGGPGLLARQERQRLGTWAEGRAAYESDSGRPSPDARGGRPAGDRYRPAGDLPGTSEDPR